MDTGLELMPKPASFTLPGTQIVPDAQLEKRTRRRFSADYKMRILAEADQCRHGELGELLRREKLYHSQLSAWRRELAKGGAAALSKTSPGPKPKLTPEEREIERLKRENAKLQRKLEVAEGCIELQKKLSRLLEQANTESDA